ncbi:hypothetical protein Patl1_00201 [Pistacia atlantica]|uniref:Uncharacterized protein n=1 Tax=Pistacia atlantica TaxID=434234 RepID=A0ACC1C7B1_9ROSI|nr:hypothetical protein Patl1_00201 [Pistacia atlantica]
MCIQGPTAKSLLETHPANIYVFLFATIIFGFAFGAPYTNFSQSPLLNIIGFITGSLSLVSLVSIIVPHWFAYTIFILWVFGSSFIIYRHAIEIKEKYNCFLQKSKKICEKINKWWKGQILPY